MSPELIIAIATLILAGVTAWMAWETRRTAKTATKGVELEQMPVLGVRDFKFDFARAGAQPSIASIRPAIEFFNADRVAVTYKIKSCELSFADHRISGPLAQRGRVLPGASITFFHPGLSLNPPVSKFPVTGRIRFEYGADGAFPVGYTPGTTDSVSAAHRSGAGDGITRSK